MIDTMTIKDRIDDAAAQKGISLRELARRIDVSASSMIKSLKENRRTYKRIPEIAKELEVPEEWIRDGGEPPWQSQPLTNPTDVPIELIENHPLVVQLKTRCISLGERYLDIVELCKEKGIDISSRGIDETKAFLDSLYGDRE